MNQKERLQVVYYLLMRDVIPSGKLAKLVQEVAKVQEKGGAIFTSKHLAAYAMELVERTLKGTG